MSVKRKCCKCGADITLFEACFFEMDVRETWVSVINTSRSLKVTSLCGYGVSEEIPPTQFHSPYPLPRVKETVEEE